jgi:hypothetical protein
VTLTRVFMLALLLLLAAHAGCLMPIGPMGLINPNMPDSDSGSNEPEDAWL